MKVTKNPNKEVYDSVKKAVQDNDGYCPCMIEQSEDTKCPCKELRENKICICGLYIRVEDNE